ncbi:MULTISPECIES: riboflavin synthase [unclassified Brachybacterium]|uniref:riboflavin synthase n=1 Tax=unclassified Brachybacterium TaxID=2623841 RepID=UPI00360EA624
MFTGLIEELGTVDAVIPPDQSHPDQPRPDGTGPDHGTVRLRIRSPHVLEDVALGDSIAVSGCCLTVADIDGEIWTADVIPTTLAATTLAGLSAGDRVNLERSLRADGRLGGHIVQGHVDGVGEILGREEGEGGTLLRLSTPGLDRYLVEKGSLTVDGVSLTVAALEDGLVTIGLIPETLERTTLGLRRVGDRVNLEVDVLAKYVEKLTAGALAGAETGR